MSQKGFPTGGVALAILVTLLVIGLVELSMGVSPMMGTVLLLGVGAIVAVMFIMFVMLSWQGAHRDTIAYQRVREVLENGKPKRGEHLVELMSALSDNDLYEVRQYIKQRLIERADSADDDDFETFEALLAEVEDKRKHR